jgi:hypothetical protein
MSAVSREAYLETGLKVLSDLGYGGLKLAELCTRLGVTTGSFYHYFCNCSAYTRELVVHWRQGRSVPPNVPTAVRTGATIAARLTRRPAIALPTGPRDRSGGLAAAK